MSTLREKIADALLDAIDPMCSSTGEARKLAEIAVAVVREHLLSDEAVEAGARYMRNGKDHDGSNLDYAVTDDMAGALRAVLSAALDGDA